MNRLKFICTICVIYIATTGLSYAAAKDRSIDLMWIMIAGVLVFFMQAGFALIESGMTRAKNSVNVLMKNFTDLCVGSLIFFLIGFGLMFGDNPTGWIGTNLFAPDQLDRYDYVHLFFQMMFAATAATIASGAMAERTHFKGYLLGVILIAAIIYPIFGSWAWGSVDATQGWLKQLGYIDFAGSSVVHAIGGWCALAGILVIGPRLGRFGVGGRIHPIPGHNLTLVTLGGFILWFCWFGFNVGSTLTVEADLGRIAINTHLSACSSVVASIIYLSIRNRPIYLTTVVNSALAGLVAVTAGCATMSPLFAILTGLIAGIVVIVSSNFILSLRVDDVVDAVAVHAISGSWGILAAGLFFDADLFNLKIVGIQLLGIFAAFLWSFPVALLGYWMIARTVGLRATAQQERRGLDYSEHAEICYPEFQPDGLIGHQHNRPS